MKSTTLAAVLVVIGVGSLVGAFIFQAYSLRPYGNAALPSQSQYLPPESYPSVMMGGPGSGFGGMMGQASVSNGQPISIAQALQTMRNIPPYVRVDFGDNTAVFESDQFNVFVLSLMPDEAVNITGRQPPSYATDDVFVIYGLINSTLVIRSGSSVRFTVVNLDDDMYHNLVVSTYGPPYGYMSMQGMMSGYWMPYLPPADYSQGTAHEYSYTLSMTQPGTFWYVCTYPQHAESGMYGTIIVSS
jgi:rusticyanin